MPKTGLTSDALVEKSLEIAMGNIRRNGLDKFRLIDIARELGVTHAALYNHFPDKEAVLDDISCRWLRDLDATLEGFAQANLPPCTAIAEWFREFHKRKLEKVQQDPELFKSFNLAVESAKPFVMRHLQNMHDQLLFMVQRAVEARQLTVSSPKAAVTLLFEATMAFHHPGLVLEHKDEDRVDLLQRVVTVVLAGLSEVR